jgi:hypothetical protein
MRQPVEQREMQVGDRRVHRNAQVPSALDARRGAAAAMWIPGVGVDVLVAVADAAAVDERRVIEQRAVPIRRGLQPVEECANCCMWN